MRERAGVSNGTLFHHFPSRQRLTTAVVAAGMADHQTALLQTLHAAGEVDDAIRQTVLRHLRWVEDDPELARLLLSTTPETLRADLDGPALTVNREFFAAVAAWFESRGWPGEPELPVLVALWIGPAQEYARGWLAAPHIPLAPAAAVLAEGAWQAIRPLLRLEQP